MISTTKQMRPNGKAVGNEEENMLISAINLAFVFLMTVLQIILMTVLQVAVV